MNGINRSSSNDLVCQLPEQEPATAAAGAPPGNDRSASVQTFQRPSKEDAPVGEDSRLEAKLRETFSELGPRESYEFTAKGDVNQGIALGFNGKVRVERQEDGRFKVQVEAAGDGGGGVRGLGNARIGIGSGTTFTVDNAADAANLVDALTKHAVVSQTNPALAWGTSALHTYGGMSGDVVDAAARIRSYGPKIGEAKVDIGGQVQLGDEFKESLVGFEAELKARAVLGGKVSVTIDPEKGEVRYATTITLDAAAKAKLPLGLKLGADAKASVSIVLTSKIPEDAVADLRAGRISAAEAAQKRGSVSKVSAQGEIELKGQGSKLASGDIKVKLKTEFAIGDTSLATDPTKLGELFANGKFSLEADVGYGAKISADAGAVKIDISATRRTKSEPYGTKLFSLGDAVKKAETFVSDGSTESFDARRAACNLR